MAEVAQLGEDKMEIEKVVQPSTEGFYNICSYRLPSTGEWLNTHVEMDNEEAVKVMAVMQQGLERIGVEKLSELTQAQMTSLQTAAFIAIDLSTDRYFGFDKTDKGVLREEFSRFLC